MFNLKDNLPFCVFIISMNPGPQLLAPGKDCTNDSRLENTTFAPGVMGENGFLLEDASFTGSLKNQINKFIPTKINSANCNDARNQIQKALDDVMFTASESMNGIGGDLKKTHSRYLC